MSKIVSPTRLRHLPAVVAAAALAFLCWRLSLPSRRPRAAGVPPVPGVDPAGRQAGHFEGRAVGGSWVEFATTSTDSGGGFHGGHTPHKRNQTASR